MDDFVTISPEKIQSGNSQHVMHATGGGTLVTKNMLTDSNTRVASLEGSLYVLCFRSNILSVKRVLFRA